jgi:predicted DNA repair protein MutK
VLGYLVNTAVSALIGAVWGAIVLAVVQLVPRRKAAETH